MNIKTLPVTHAIFNAGFSGVHTTYLVPIPANTDTDDLVSGTNHSVIRYRQP